MNTLVLVRYGEHENGHLNESGKNAMILVGEKLKSLFDNKNIGIVCAQVPRAIESAQIISKCLGIFSVQNFTELYAEEGRSVNLEKVKEVLDSVGGKRDVLIAVVSREYIETLPNFILQNLGVQKTIETHLERGEFLILDYDKNECNLL